MDENQEKEVINETQQPVDTNENQEMKETDANLDSNVTKENEEQQETTQNEEALLINPKNKKIKKGSYITGTIGALLGGLIASIPWILTYVYANMVIAVLATPIAGGAFLGYKIFKGRISKFLPVILVIVSLLVVTLITTVISPTILMVRAGYPLTYENWAGLFYRDNIRLAILEDLVISLLFTVIGIIAVINSIRIQIKNGIEREKLEFNTQALYEQSKKQVIEQSEAIKKACTGLNCMNKENAVAKQEILNELEMTHGVEHKKVKSYFAACVSYKLLKKHKGKYYFDEIDEQTKIEKATTVNGRHVSSKATIIIIIVAIIIGAVAGYVTSNMDTQYTVPNTNIELEIDSSQILYGTAKEITEAFDETSAAYYDFIIKDGAEDKYDIYGQLINKSEYEGYEFATIMQLDRDYYAQYMGEEATSQVSDKQFGDKLLKEYNYTYQGNDGNQYRAIIYLYESENHYLWINVYADLDLELTQIDTMIDNLFK